MGRKRTRPRVPLIKIRTRGRKPVISSGPTHTRTSLTPIQTLQILETIELECCRRHLAPFVQLCFRLLNPNRELLWNWHLDYICDWLEAVYYREIDTVIINVAPRSLKSLCCSVGFPAWLLGKEPSHQVMCGSYTNPLSLRHSVDTRYIVGSEPYQVLFPKTIIQAGSDTKEKFATTERGYRVAVTVGGGVIGEGCDTQVIDDPHNPKRALSERERYMANEVWLDHTMSTRFNDPRNIRRVVVMQRLNTLDQSGHLLAKKLPNTIHVKLPTEAPKDEIIQFPRQKRTITRVAGELLHPERLGPKENDAAKINLNPYGYAAQHGQEPTPLGGGRIQLDWFPRYSYISSNGRSGRVIVSVDTANKPTQLSNRSVIEVFTECSQYWALTNVIAGQWAFSDLRTNVEGVCNAVKPALLMIEDKASGTSLIQVLQKETMLPVVAVEPVGDKITRMEEGLGLLASGRIALPDPTIVEAPWLFGLETLLQGYPNVHAWDEIDALSQFLRWLRVEEEATGELPLIWAAKRAEEIGIAISRDYGTLSVGGGDFGHDNY